MKKFKHVQYSNGYAIGELNKDDYITGVGYTYYSETDKYIIGSFKNGLMNGWTFSNLNENDEVDGTFFKKSKEGKTTEGVLMNSNPDFLEICETNKDGLLYGYDLIIWDDNTWRYQYFNPETNETKAIQFLADSDELIMTYIVEGEKVWKKQIGKNKISGFGIPFNYFKNKTFKDASFQEVGNKVIPTNDGPAITHNSHYKETVIYNTESKNTTAKQDISYYDTPAIVNIVNIKNDCWDGGYFQVYKKNADWKYLFYEKGNLHDISVFWTRDTCNLQVRKYCYGENDIYDVIDIDKDFNVKYYTKFNKETKEYDSVVEYDYNEIYLKDH